MTPAKKSKSSSTDLARIAWVSDVHLGNQRVPARKILTYLRSLFNKETIHKYRAIVISGDLFDKRLPHDSQEVFDIHEWMCEFVELSVIPEIPVSIIILKGTVSHDQNQPKWFVSVSNALKHLGADLKYYDEITVDVMWEGGPTCLYIPDEMNHDASVTYAEAVEVMKMYGVDKVDVACMHGMFHFQEPIRTVTSHDEEKYHAIVRFLIVIGHHHTHARSGIIRVPGSIERLRFNEEEDKGHYECVFSLTKGVVEEEFIVNKNAEIFSMFDVQGWSYDQVIALLDSKNHLPDGSRLRLKATRYDEAVTGLSGIKNKYPHFRIDTKRVDLEKAQTDTVELIKRPVMTTIRPDTLKGLLLPRLPNVSAETMKIADLILDEL